MFVPDVYRKPDGSWEVHLIRSNPLAVLVSNGFDNGTVPVAPYATHVPIILDPAVDEGCTAVPGVTLWGHMNRANPHWSALTSGIAVVAVFSGPHGYVSPTVYQKTPVAPTWNFTAVHVRGILQKVEPDEPGEETLLTVTSTVRALEADFGNGWSMNESLDYFGHILPGVGAFRVAVTHVDGMFKLSQEQDGETRRLVGQSFAAAKSTGHRAVAAMMDRLSSVGCPAHETRGP